MCPTTIGFEALHFIATGKHPAKLGTLVEAAFCATIRRVSHPSQFESVTVQTKANVFFDGKVISHGIAFDDGSKKTLGLIYPGSYHFGTDKPERMDIVDGECAVVLDGATAEVTYGSGSSFQVPGKSGFTISVNSGLVEYICSFL